MILPKTSTHLNPDGVYRHYGIWGNDTTIWISGDDSSQYKLFTYKLKDKMRDSDKDVVLSASTLSRGIWSNDTTM